MEKQVTGCIDCPFSYSFDISIGYGCTLDNSDRTIKQHTKKYIPIDPEWCPLKEEDITIKLNLTEWTKKKLKK